MKRSPIVGVMGGGSAAPSDMAAAERPGRLIAEAGWILLTGGRAAGIMEAAARGAARRRPQRDVLLHYDPRGYGNG